jgi:hypothetical protein
MGLTKTENASGLSFEIDHPQTHYSPGDLISGRVTLHTAEDSAIGRITVNLWGRTKSRIIQQHGQAVTYHRGRVQLFNQEKILYEGQYTHKPGSFTFPFEFIVPDRADPLKILASEKWKPKEHFPGTADENNLDLTLPASNHHSRIMFGRQAECFVEYVLSATVTEPEGLHHIRKAQSKISTLPIIFHPLSTPEPIQDWNHITDLHSITISTLKLLPEHAGTSLGIRDRARSIFQRDSIPKFSFDVQVQAPSVIQLFHPTPIPFLITITPDLSPQNTTIDTSHGLPLVVLRSATIELKTHVRCRAAGTFSDSKTYEIPIIANKPINQRLPFSDKSAEMSLSAGEETLDLGQLCDLRLGNANLGSKLETPLCPSYNTYNVAREYHLTWELEIECAERIEKFSSKKNGPACQVIMPAATTETTFPVSNDAEMLGAELVQAQSSGSSGFWSRRRTSGESGGNGAPIRGEKEKAGFTPASTALASDRKRALRAKTKEQEAAEDRARTQAEEGGFQNPYENPFVSELDADPTMDIDTPRQNAGAPTLRAPVTDASGFDDGNQLPKYVP